MYIIHVMDFPIVSWNELSEFVRLLPHSEGNYSVPTHVHAQRRYMWQFAFSPFLSIQTTPITKHRAENIPSSIPLPCVFNTHSNPSMYNLSKTHLNMSLDLLRAHHFLAFLPDISERLLVVICSTVQMCVEKNSDARTQSVLERKKMLQKAQVITTYLLTPV